MKINRLMKRRKRAQILIVIQRKRRKKRRKKSHLSRCGQFSACPYLRNSRSISTQTRMSTIRCSMTCLGRTRTRMTRMRMTKRKNMEISSREKTLIKRKRRRRLMRGSKSTNNRCYNNLMTTKMRILITQSLSHMTCLCNEIWAQTQ